MGLGQCTGATNTTWLRYFFNSEEQQESFYSCRLKCSEMFYCLGHVYDTLGRCYLFVTPGLTLSKEGLSLPWKVYNHNSDVVSISTSSGQGTLGERCYKKQSILVHLLELSNKIT